MDMNSLAMDRAGLRKAAVFLASLGPAAAERLLSQLSTDQANVVREALSAIDRIDPVEQQQILEEFRRIQPPVSTLDDGGIELDALPWPGRGDADRDSFDTFAIAGSSPDEGLEEPCFQFLQAADDERLADLLRHERPQTVALVLSHLPPQRAGEVLTYLPSSSQVEIVRRLADIDAIDPAAVREVDRALRSRWTQPATAPRLAGSDVAAKILASCDGPTRGQILNNLAAHDQSLAERFGGRAIAFEELVRVNDDLLRAVLRSADPAIVEAALLGAPPKLLERFLGSLPPAKAKRLRAKLDRPAPIRLSDVEEARRQLAALAQRLLANSPDKSSAA